MNHKTEKKHLAVSISMVWAIRNVVHSGLLEKLIERFEVFVVFRKPAPEVEALCRAMGAQTWVAPQVVPAGRPAAFHRRLVDWLNQAHKLRHDLHSEEMKKDVARRQLARMQKTRLNLRDNLLRALGKSAFYDLMVSLERRLYYRSHDLNGLHSFLGSNGIDLFLLTAPFQQESGEIHWMRACKESGVRTTAMVLGFDNLTTKGRLPEFTDQYLVWNEIMKSEVPRIYPNVSPAQVFVTGSSQFDFYASSKWGTTREAFCEKLGLDPAKPILLYAANGEALVPNEEDLVLDLVRRAQDCPGLAGVQFVVRLHPFENRLERWQAVGAMPHVVLSSPWQAEADGSWGSISAEDIHILVSSLKHSFCNVNISSTMALDSIFCDRPAIGPAYALGPEPGLSVYTRKLYDREHYLPITHSGALVLAHSPDELIPAILYALEHPEAGHAERSRLTCRMLGKPLGEAGRVVCDRLIETSREYTPNP